MPVYCSKDPSMWQWFAFRFDEGGCEWRKQGDEDVYEQVIVRRGKEPGLQAFFYTFPDKDEISTNDLYRPHPTIPNLWMHQGRVDDLIVFSNGEKLHPAAIEDIVGAHPQIKGALVVGVGRFQPGLILEPTTDPVNEQERNELVESVWPWIERANKETAAHGRISRDLVMVAKPGKPFLRAGKGTLQKASTLKLYAPDIDNLYETAAEAAATGTPTNGLSPLDFSSEEALTRSMGVLFHEHLGGPALEPDDDFFLAGKYRDKSPNRGTGSRGSAPRLTTKLDRHRLLTSHQRHPPSSCRAPNSEPTSAAPCCHPARRIQQPHAAAVGPVRVADGDGIRRQQR